MGHSAPQPCSAHHGARHRAAQSAAALALHRRDLVSRPAWRHRWVRWWPQQPLRAPSCGFSPRPGSVAPTEDPSSGVTRSCTELGDAEAQCSPSASPSCQIGHLHHLLRKDFSATNQEAAQQSSRNTSRSARAGKKSAASMSSSESRSQHQASFRPRPGHSGSFAAELPCTSRSCRKVPPSPP